MSNDSDKKFDCYQVKKFVLLNDRTKKPERHCCFRNPMFNNVIINWF